MTSPFSTVVCLTVFTSRWVVSPMRRVNCQQLQRSCFITVPFPSFTLTRIWKRLGRQRMHWDLGGEFYIGHEGQRYSGETVLFPDASTQGLEPELLHRPLISVNCFSIERLFSHRNSMLKNLLFSLKINIFNRRFHRNDCLMWPWWLVDYVSWGWEGRRIIDVPIQQLLLFVCHVIA